ncbi:MAG: GntR family transcriptional regulator [Clostridioides sp.]|nr:GntR family transcriptional regulator [Clostridioides sp.]
MNQVISLDEKTSTPVYRQICASIIEMKKNGILKENDKLPTERSLSEQLGVSRGTVKKAYADLMKDGYIVSKRGNGTYISSKGSHRGIDKDGLKVVDTIEELKKFGYSYDEIKVIFDLFMSRMENGFEMVNIAIVDCNQEALTALKRRFLILKNVNLTTVLLSDVREFKYPVDVFKKFDLIVTTKTHYLELHTILNGIGDKIVKTVLSADKETVINLAGIKDPENTGIITKSVRFAEIIKSNLYSLSIDVPEENFVSSDEQSVDSILEFIEGKKYLVVPPMYSIDFKLSGNSILEFVREDGEPIIFKYNIEDGSMIYVEEKIKEIREKKFLEK